MCTAPTLEPTMVKLTYGVLTKMVNQEPKFWRWRQVIVGALLAKHAVIATRDLLYLLKTKPMKITMKFLVPSKYTTQQKFPNSSFRDLNLKIHIL